MTPCHLCARESVSELLDFGMQPICSRYLADPGEEEFRHPMRLLQCDSCGMVQMGNPVPAGELKPRFDWITYVEPEGHLDRLADTLSGLPGVTKESAFCGLSFKDDSLLQRMRERGFSKTWRVDERSRRAQGRPDVVVARHIFEHAHEPRRFMRDLRELVGPSGTLVVEVPDCSRALEQADYTTLWEEHILYFTPGTFQWSFSFCGFSLDRFEQFPYPLEDSLVGIGRPTGQKAASSPSESVLADERHRAGIFAGGLSRQREKFKGVISGHRRKQEKVALMGAGHLACTFINLLDLKEEIDFVVDGDPHKKGLWMPGSRLPIYDSEALLENKVGLCLLGVNPANQGKVAQRHRSFLERGGRFLSIFPDGQVSSLAEIPSS
ncbi:MAG: methyltransferase domain-containing protein [Candidatus Omnitrophica bacterium]|nr:methyltransferase domain-containing protein [Candidatus Omnitrophota bacterium]